tara:strand:+ start:5201 stop:5623 length:423 start_codon:yes stop_codon:yes gene_type:complete
MDNTIAHNNTVHWIQSALNRFDNMYLAKLDMAGKPAIDKAINHLYEHGTLTSGAVQYLFDRTHANGSVPKYNTHRGYNKKYGEMIACDLQSIIDSKLVDWTTAKHALKPNLIRSINLETDHEWYRGNLRKKPPIMADLFE